MPKIREANKYDIKNLLLIENESFSDNAEIWNEEALYFAVEDNLYKTFIIADENDFAIGYAIMTVSEYEIYIAKFGISKEVRGCGYGEKLLRYIIDNVKAEIYVLEVRSQNIPAINLYKKLGFVEEGLREGMYHNPTDDALVLVRKEKRCLKYVY